MSETTQKLVSIDNSSSASASPDLLAEASLSTPLTDAALALCQAFGKDIGLEDFLVGLPIGDGDLSQPMVIRALDRVGLTGAFEKRRKITAKDAPIAVGLKDGGWDVVLGVDKSFVYLANEAANEGQIAVPVAEFKSVFAGQVLQAKLQIEDIQRRHTGKTRDAHWFWGGFSNQRPLIRDIVLGTFVANILAVAISLFALQVYDRVIPNQSMATLTVLVIGTCIAIFCEALLRIARSHIMDQAGRKIELTASAFLFSRLTGMKLSSRPNSPGGLAYAMREFSSVREFFTASSIGMVADIPFVLIFLLLIYGIAGNVVWVIVAGMIAIIIPSLLMRKTIMRLAEEMQGGTAAASKLLTEICYNHETVKAHGGEALLQRRFEEITALNAQKTSQQRLVAAMLTFWSSGVQSAAYVGAVVAGVFMVFTGDFTVGTIIAVSILTTRAIAPITQLSGAISRWEQVKTALTGLEAIATSEQDRDLDRSFARREKLSGHFVLRDTEFAYDPEGNATLKIGRLEIAARDKLCLLGVNGSGKSTLLKVLSGLFSFSGGSVTVDGMDIRQIDPSDLRRNIGYLPQEVKLFTGTLRENITMGNLRFSEERILAAAAFSGMDRIIETHPLGLDLPITDGGEGLSVGQRQSVGLARLFLQDPSIVLLDEPTASLDQNAEAALLEKLELWLAKRTCILTTHRMAVLKLTNKVAVLQNGSIALQGPKNEVIAQLQKKNGPGEQVGGAHVS